MLELDNMTAGDLSALISGDAGENTYSKRFGESVYGTMAFKLGKYESQQKHLLDVLESTEDARPILDLIAHEENPAQILEILSSAGVVDDNAIKKAFDCGEAACNKAREAGRYGVAAALAKAAAAIRKSIYGEQPDDSEQEAAA